MLFDLAVRPGSAMEKTCPLLVTFVTTATMLSVSTQQCQVCWHFINNNEHIGTELTTYHAELANNFTHFDITAVNNTTLFYLFNAVLDILIFDEHTPSSYQ